MVADRALEQDLVRRRARQRVARHVERVAVGLAAIPEHLDQAEDQLPLELVRVRRVERIRVLRDEAARVARVRVRR